MLKAALLIFLIVLFPVVGGSVVLSTLQTWRAARAAADWPTVVGEIQSSELRKELARLGRGESSRHGQSEVFAAHVDYQYQVDGKTYHGDRITWQDSLSSDRYQAEQTVNRYRKGPIKVSYDPDDPSQSLLAPEETGFVIPGLIIGIALMLLPSGLITIGLRHDWIDRPHLPIHLQPWWDRFFVAKNSIVRTSQSIANHASDSTLPGDSEFVETIVHWDIKRRIEIKFIPSSITVYVAIAAVAGIVVAWFGMFPVTHLLFQRPTPHGPELQSVAVSLFALASGTIFFTARLIDRGSHLVIDLQSGWIDARREFARPHQCSLHDVNQVVIRCIEVSGRRVKFRAAVELDLAGEKIVVARTCQPRRKQESAQQQALSIGEPLASALGKTIEFAGWDS